MLKEERKKEIEAKIRARKVVMFSVTTCRFCTQAKGILAKYSLSKDDYEVMELDQEEDGGDISRYLLLKTHKSSVPRIFINGKCIGGCTELRALHGKKLKDLLELSDQTSRKLHELQTMPIKKEAKDIVEAKIKERKVMIFSKSLCPYCKKAKRLFEVYRLGKDDYEVMELDRVPGGGDIQSYLSVKTGARTVPRVFVNGKCIGGYTETKEIHGQKLKDMIHQNDTKT